MYFMLCCKLDRLYAPTGAVWTVKRLRTIKCTVTVNKLTNATIKASLPVTLRGFRLHVQQLANTQSRDLFLLAWDWQIKLVGEV